MREIGLYKAAMRQGRGSGGAARVAVALASSYEFQRCIFFRSTRHRRYGTPTNPYPGLRFMRAGFSDWSVQRSAPLPAGELSLSPHGRCHGPAGYIAGRAMTTVRAPARGVPDVGKRLDKLRGRRASSGRWLRALAERWNRPRSPAFEVSSHARSAPASAKVMRHQLQGMRFR